MKPKSLLCLALVLSGGLIGCFNSQSAYGYQEQIRLNPANLKSDYSFVRISTLHLNLTNDEMVVYYVVVMPKDGHKPANFEGFLDVKDSNIKGRYNYIASTSVPFRKLSGGPPAEGIPESLKAKCVVFQFSIAAKYLEASEFRVEEALGKFDAGPMYCFNLKEFTADK
jgi:hypothetical protein